MRSEGTENTTAHEFRARHDEVSEETRRHIPEGFYSSATPQCQAPSWHVNLMKTE